MGTLVGHVAPGFGFLLIGLWQLFNHTKLHLLRPSSYVAPPWFPVPSKLRYIELILIAAGSCTSIAMELFIGPRNHQPLDEDGTIPPYHLHNFEHASISAGFLVYAITAAVLDRARYAPSRDALVQALAGVAFGQQLLLFHLHSTDHMGVEGQYHWLLQLVIAVSLATTLLGIPYTKSFIVAFVRSASITFQGLWFIAMGYALWTPELIPKGCFMNMEEGHYVVRCHDEASLDRARSLVNILFSWFVVSFAIFAVCFYFCMAKLFPEEPEYLPLVPKEMELDDVDDLEKQKLGESNSFIHIGKGMESIELER